MKLIKSASLTYKPLHESLHVFIMQKSRPVQSEA